MQSRTAGYCNHRINYMLKSHWTQPARLHASRHRDRDGRRTSNVARRTSHVSFSSRPYPCSCLCFFAAAPTRNTYTVIAITIDPSFYFSFSFTLPLWIYKTMRNADYCQCTCVFLNPTPNKYHVLATAENSKLENNSFLLKSWKFYCAIVPPIHAYLYMCICVYYPIQYVNTYMKKKLVVNCRSLSKIYSLLFISGKTRNKFLYYTKYI